MQTEDETVLQNAHLDQTITVGTLLFQPHLGPEKLAGLVRWLDLRDPHI